MPYFNKILIANRGEIAVRVIRACKEMGIPTVAIYSSADTGALHTQIADEAVLIGPPPPLESYLNIDKIISVCRERGADAIHPGYGFLAENPAFAKRCEDEGITFIGPTSRAIELLGNKVESRKVMTSAGIPCTPGAEIKGLDFPAVEKTAGDIGYPILIKAAAGGGGKGMRIVHNPEDLQKSIESAMRESKSAFADDTVYIEKYLERPRHIEFQILADNHGNVIHLCERECSIQRRHQKVIEETPSTALTPELRAKMGATAVQVAKASGYTNAGTVEFLYAGGGKYYFLEVNTRLQVEHPITEMVVGVDIVAEQIRIARGEKLRFKQEDIIQRGHAVECRIYAEDPEKDFLPSAGKILFMKEPSGPGIRHDCGVFSGWDVPVHYDPILSKLIAWGPDRESARKRMVNALKDFPLLGVATSIEFLRKALETEDYIKGETYTDFIPKNFPKDKPLPVESSRQNLALIATAIVENAKSETNHIGAGIMKTYDAWDILGNWEIG
jgi:acetyl-CoA carboxylase biotin carboxylase subunit